MMLLFPSYIKIIVWAVFILSGIGLLLMYVLPAGPLPQQGGPQPLPPPAETVQLQGTIKDWGSNRMGDIDKLLISTADGDNWVRFPPHTARQVMKYAPKEKQVVLLVHTGPHGGPAKEAAYLLVQLQTGDAVLPVEGVPQPPPVAGKSIDLSGPIDRLLVGKHGEVTGFVMKGYMVAIPPHLAHSIAPLLQQGLPVLVKGYERSDKDGFVNTNNLQLLKPYRMTIDSTDYLL